MINHLNLGEVVLWQTGCIVGDQDQNKVQTAISEIIELMKKELDVVYIRDEIEVHFDAENQFFWGKGYSDEIAKILAKYFVFNGIDQSISITVRNELNWRVKKCVTKQFFKNGEFHSEYKLNIPEIINDKVLEITADHAIFKTVNIDDLADDINDKIIEVGAKSGKEAEKAIFDFLNEAVKNAGEHESNGGAELITVNKKLNNDNEYDPEFYFIRMTYAE